MNMTRHFLIPFLLTAFTWASFGPAATASEISSAWAEEEQTSVRLIASRDGLGADGVVRAGIEFAMQPGWKVYWRSPGDAGFPPQPKFKGSDNANVSPLSWPVPLRFSVLGLETLGYEDSVILPFTVKAIDITKDSRVSANIRYLTCKEICIPYDAEVSMTIPPGNGAPTALAHTIGQFDSRVPRTPSATRLNISEAWTEHSEKGLYVVASATSEIPFKGPDLYLEGPIGLGFGAPATRLSNAKQSAMLRIPISGFLGTPAEAAAKLSGTSFIFTMLDGGRAMEASVSLGEPKSYIPDHLAATTGQPVVQSIAVILVFAFLGGLILNLMPCVLPVLSLKFLGVVKHGGAAPGEVRARFLASAAGIIFAFLVLAGALIGLKSIGASIGWGIQFQHPWFLIIMAFLVTMFACNMWGFFEFRLPGAVASAGHQGSRREGLIGHFLQGIFATLLATPCSAPFLGTAIGFALARGSVEIISVFAVLGLGLSTPYLLIAAVPKLATMMPKPGPWMVRLKFVLGLALAATALWLLSVIAGVAGTGEAIVTGVVLVFVALWLGKIIPLVPEINKATPYVLVVATMAAIANAEISDMDGPLDTETPSVSKIAWQDFDPAAIDRIVSKGRIVFVDVTADWCITCQVNKRFVLERGRILELLNSPDVVAMRADWTRPDPMIADYLSSFGRYGIPFNAIYGTRAPDGFALPELLSDGNVLSGFRTAAPEQLASQFQ